MLSVVFVCLGNICRSPTAEAVFKRMVEEDGLSSSFSVTSYGTSDCEEGNPVYRPARAVLEREGYDFKHFARRISLKEVKNADYVLVMDGMNLRDLLRLTGGHYSEKIFRLASFLSGGGDIDDPWYTGDFDRAYGEIYSSCRAFLDYIKREHSAALDYDRRH